jgi:hypothetical protein
MSLSRLRPALYGALLLVLVVGGRMFLRPSHLSAIAVLRLLLAAGAAGAAAGLTYEFIGRRLIQVPRFGPYLQGMACVGAYILAFACIAPFAFGEPLITGGLSIILYLGVTVLFGLLMGLGYAQAERGLSFYAADQTNWRFVAGLILVGAFLLVAMKVAHWW